jgi:hypothetical protein
VNESFGSAVPASVLTERLSDALIEKLSKLYPLRCKVADVKDNEARLNIGVKVGVRMGQQFKVMDQDLILEVIGVQPETCLATIAKGKGPLQKGLRVEEL